MNPSSIAIVLTIVYLSIESRQNAEAARTQVRQKFLASDQQHLQLLITDPELSWATAAKSLPIARRPDPATS